VTAVGVVVPVRNGAAHLGAALESVLAQSPPPADVVVVDGGSTDGSGDLARTFPGVRVVEQQGRGLAGARNQGLAVVAGDLIAFCDADDAWTAGSLATRRAALAASGADAVVGRMVARALDGPVPARLAERLDRPVPGYTPGALLVRRPALEAVGPFDESLAIGTDSDWFVRLVQSEHRLEVLDDVVLEKGARADSLSGDVEAYREELLVVAAAYLRRRRGGPSVS
jgi:glycosyltransferase involved in cell wall biosynthesis